MQRERRLRWATRALLAAAAVSAGLSMCGCGMPGAPQPPSLNLPERVTDLATQRAGGKVSLTWTMPVRNTDKVLLKGNVQARVCRKENETGACVQVASVEFAPGADATFSETLSDTLTSGAPRVLTYFVELVNRKGQSAGLSNGAAVLAGQAPGAIAGFGAEMRRDGVMLSWTPGEPGAAPTVIRIERKLLTQPGKPQTKDQRGLFAPQREPALQTLLVQGSEQDGRALDKDIRFGESYAYRAQRVEQVAIGNQKLGLAGPVSEEVRIDAIQLFPPAVPTGLAAVATMAEGGIGPAIDLSWQPNTDSDLAGYIIYRREGSDGWQRISPEQPVVGVGFHDPDVQAGHTYSYAVSAVDQEGHESTRSAEEEETVPGP